MAIDEEHLFNFRLEILKQEIDQLQQNIRNYNNSLVVIKGWSITIFSGLISFSIKDRNINILIIGIITCIMFWIFDASVRRVQQFFISRYNKIEWFLRNTKLLNEAWAKLTFPRLNFPDLTGTKSVRDLEFKTTFIRVAIRSNVSLLYIIQISVILIVWILLRLNCL
jgi:hypothetical protein